MASRNSIRWSGNCKKAPKDGWREKSLLTKSSHNLWFHLPRCSYHLNVPFSLPEIQYFRWISISSMTKRKKNNEHRQRYRQRWWWKKNTHKIERTNRAFVCQWMPKWLHSKWTLSSTAIVVTRRQIISSHILAQNKTIKLCVRLRKWNECNLECFCCVTDTQQFDRSASIEVGEIIGN